MSIEEELDNLQEAKLEELYNLAVKFGLLERYKNLNLLQNIATLSYSERIQKQRNILIELECGKVNEIYKLVLQKNEIDGFSDAVYAIEKEVNLIPKSDLQKELLVGTKILKPILLIEEELNRLKTLENIVKKILVSEDEYILNIQWFLQNFQQKLQASTFSKDTTIINFLSKLELFSGIYKLSEQLLNEFKKVINSKNIDVQTQIIAQIFNTNINSLATIYHNYGINYDELISINNNLSKNNVDFSKFCQDFTLAAAAKNFAFYTGLPMQRINDYCELIQELIQYSPMQANNIQGENILFIPLSNIINITNKINKARINYARTKMFVQAEGFKITIENIKYQNLKFQHVYQNGPTIFNDSGFVVENKESGPQSNNQEMYISDNNTIQNRAESTVKDHLQREILKIKYRHENSEEHMDIICNKKMIQQFLQSKPQPQFINLVELYEMSIKAVNIIAKNTKINSIIKDSAVLSKKSVLSCKILAGNSSVANNAEYIRELADSFIAQGVKGIIVSDYPSDINARKVEFFAGDFHILQKQEPNDDDLQIIKTLLDRYQGLLSAGYIPVIPNISKAIFSQYNNAHGRSFLIDINDSIVAIKQYEALMEDNIRITLTLSPATRGKMLEILTAESSFKTIGIKPIITTSGNIIKNKDHAFSLSKLQMAIQLGFIPDFQENFLIKIHLLPIRSPITIPTNYPNLAFEQWKILMGSGIPAIFEAKENAPNMQDYIKKEDKFITINTNNSQNAMKCYKGVLDIDCIPILSDISKATILSEIAKERKSVINKITVVNPTFAILSGAIKDGLLVDLYDEALDALIKNLQQMKKFPPIELINIQQAKNIPLLKAQIRQIEQINVKCALHKIQYAITDQTKQILAQVAPQEFIEECKYYYRDLTYLDTVDPERKDGAFLNATPTLTYLDQFIHERLETFTQLYAKENLIFNYKKRKRFFERTKVSKKVLEQMDEMQIIINSIDNSQTPMNAAKIKTSNNPMHRWQTIHKELKNIRTTIKNTRTWWFTSRLVSILDQMVVDLEIIQKMHDICAID